MAIRAGIAPPTRTIRRAVRDRAPVVGVEMSDTSLQPGSSRFKRSISTDSFLRELTDDGLPKHYYGRTKRTPLNLAVCVGGVIGSLCIYGVLQERLMTIPYGGTTEEPESAEMFTSSVFLVLMNRLVTVCISALGIALTGDSFKTTIPLNLYASIAFANLVTTVCQYEVLKYLSFAASTLAKCAKIIPVMIWGKIILHKSYRWRDYAMAALVTSGCFLFVLDRGVIQNRQLRHGGDATLGPDGMSAATPDAPPAPSYYDPADVSDPVVSYTSYFDASDDEDANDRHERFANATATANANEEEEETGAQVLNDIIAGGGGRFVDSVLNRGQAHAYVLGTIIMCVYLGFDGFTSTFQQKLYRHYTCSILNQIFFTTCFSAVFSSLWLLTTRQITHAVSFLERHPGAIQDIFVLSVSAAVSQFAISYTIFCFGAVTLASVMTSRQFLSVVISCLLFGAPLSFLQWAGLLMVLAPVADRVMLERSKPEVFGKSPGGAKTRGGEGEHDDVDASPRAGDGFGPIAVPGQIPDDYFSARGTGHTPRSSANFSPRSSERSSPRSSVSERPSGRSPTDGAWDERSRLVQR